MRTSPLRNRGFSLLELIVVILIIGIVAAFVTPAASTILRGSQLSQASQILTDQFSLARQLALTKNGVVEVRLIRFVDPGVPGDKSPDDLPGAFRAIQCFEILSSGAAIPMDKIHVLPQSIIMNPQGYSTLLSHSSMTLKTPVPTKDPQVSSVGHAYNYVAFRFMPDGSTSLSSTSGTKWFVTIHNMNDKPNPPSANSGVKKGTDNTPVNFFTLQIDPVLGTTKSYRPGV